MAWFVQHISFCTPEPLTYNIHEDIFVQTYASLIQMRIALCRQVDVIARSLDELLANAIQFLDHHLAFLDHFIAHLKMLPDFQHKHIKGIAIIVINDCR